MKRPLPKAFFWIDQALVRQGLWLKLGAQAKLAYVALAASVDRQGLSIWSRSKLMKLAHCEDPDRFEETLVELEREGLIQRHDTHVPPAISLTSFEPQPSSSGAGTGRVGGFASQSSTSPMAGTPLSIHTHIHWTGGGHADS